MVKQKEWEKISELLEDGLSVPKVAEEVGRSAPTIYKLIKTGGPKTSRQRGMKIPKKLKSFDSYLRKRIKKGVSNDEKLLSELKKLGYKGSYSSLNRYLKGTQNSNQNYKPAIRFETRPGEQGQFDWGSFGKIEVNGKVERLYGFVYVLGFSRMMYVEFVIKQNLQTLIQSHINAFNYLGIPQSILYDNIKTVVLRREKL
ncbi:hypothetical protein A2630_04175 [Candidatus Woesebacteria bacterium RIFCSPHIGHO2_01_FULL_44_10]|uniref:Integrase catalytic domain-containing protein n=1 Tax=Candidatus Woesebacteria bacterium RIFCSPLOWO2_01_FULL_44_14 TaxID=1802525 RepID=A0A1F8C1K1_9BACT|nr:MAG: hypothetical protein A2630_04175 [Candidatus Woesebacteria bacterium RIFCSPHIGHO2_01_FULL_44_10]OGM55460.1 MAG: hypothetical protein A3F62_00520 [Candidatus Woesebacteria bacterium RIFCSPHIGHO2_12_FULL_44_11]OGM70132.1 MAG: hypothetical protein A2975_03590 [Candidatus Woesebacteria bacterium RIFCSPLOWO2_01_FULL_44_14]